MRMPQFLQLLWEKIKSQREEKRQPTDDAYKPSTDLHSYSHGSIHLHPTPEEMQHRAAEQQYWQEQLRLAEDLNVLTRKLNTITMWAAIVALVGLIGLYYTFSETRRQANVATQALHSQRPYVTLGKEDGIVAEYKPPREGERKGTILVYFRNAGPAPALSFLANVYSWWLYGPTGARHIERYRVIFPTGGTMYPYFPNAIVGADSVYSVTVDPKWTPYIDEWELVDADKLEGGFGLMGNVEYCDWWGKYHCSDFHIDYRPFPISKFIAETSECLVYPRRQKESEISQGSDVRIEILPRCEQPEEREEKENKAK